MSRRIIWAKGAILDRADIFKYWNERNKSKVYSKKLNSEFNWALESLRSQPESGKKIDYPGARQIIVRSYAVIYRYNDEVLFVLSIWEGHQHPSTK